MGCCPQNHRTAPLTERHRMQVRYNGGRPVVVKGPVTGTSYQFSGVDRVQLVDPRDAIIIVRNPVFRIEGIVEVDLGQGEASNG
jgi:hypothetical protein